MLSMRRQSTILLCFLGLAMLAGGCARSTLRPDEVPEARLVGGIGEGFFEDRVEAFVVPPDGWRLDPPKGSDQHTHLTWISPSGDTAYGVIYIELPVYAFATKWMHEIAFDRFIDQMRQDQGEAQLHAKRWNGSEKQMEFEVEGGLYRMQAFLSLRGTSGWAVYSGRLRERQINPDEMAIAHRARDATLVGREAGRLGPPEAVHASDASDD